ncbi:Ultraviolet-B receptor UVR8 [Morella rubra]|uniref:Ultraviolet-B receptor UVR8 n=1 Tax=Morella rubra TaxID=262757 RepID=A0A6A1VF57_9ROSI|nr:Ultraviolet-B receptor UVR8 [Morella rubra]
MGEESLATAPYDRAVEQAIVSMKKGAYLLKCGRRGKPKFCPFKLSSDEKYLIWYSGQREKQLKLSSVKEIISGQVSFRRQLQPEKECQSFSLIYGERSLDVICKDKSQADCWYVGLRAIISRCHHPKPLSRSWSRSGVQTCVNSPAGFFRRKHHLGLLEDSDKLSQNAMSISIPNSVYTEADNPKNMPLITRVFHQKEKNNILKDVMAWGEGIGGVVGGGVDRFDNHDRGQEDALLPNLLESTKMFDVQSLSLGRKHAALVTKHGEVFCWGEEKGGRLGHKINIDVSFPKIVDSLIGIHVKSVACGEYQTCAITDTGELYTWGDNGCGADLMGEERKKIQWLPCKLCGPFEGINVSNVACGEWHTAVVSSSGKLFTYGDGTFGVLGHGNLQSVSQPKEVESLKGLWVKSVACGSWHTAAIIDIMVDRSQLNAKGGKLFTWGDGDNGRLGHANEERKFLPTCVAQLVDHDFVRVSCGRMFTAGLTNLGTVYTMGSAVHGQLGNPQGKDKSITIVQGKLKEEFVKEISSGSFHIAVLTSSGRVYTWGKGANGQLGLGDIEDRNSPSLVVALRDRQVESIACGSSFTAAICLHKTISVSDQSACTACKLQFGFVRKKHNCYNCGLLFCRACCGKKITNASLAPNTSKAFRVCDPCFNILPKIVYSNGPFKQESRSPKQLLTEQKIFPDKKEEKGNVAPKSGQILSIRQYCDEGGNYGGRNTLGNKWENQQNVQSSSSLPGGLPLLQGQVSCSPSFKMYCPDSSGSLIPLSGNQSSSLSPLRSLSTISSHLDGEKGMPNELLIEEVQRLRAEARSLESQNEIRSQKIQECQQRIQETWSLAREETAKCKAAKEVIKALALRLHMLSEKVSTRKLNDGVQASLPQIRPLYTDNLGVSCPMIVATQPPPEVGSPQDREVGSLYNSPDLFSDTLKSKFGRDVCRANTGSMENSHMARTKSPQNGTKASKLEWVEQYEPGVYITFTILPSGRKGLKRVRFSRKQFTESEAAQWWEENQVIVYEKYEIEGYSNSS